MRGFTVAIVLLGFGLTATPASAQRRVTSGLTVCTATVNTSTRQQLASCSQLTSYDSNKDGKLSALDSSWNRLRCGTDVNQDGTLSSSERRTLSDCGVREISLSGGCGTFALDNGSTRSVRRIGSPSGPVPHASWQTGHLVLDVNGNGVKLETPRGCSHAWTAMNTDDAWILKP